MPLNHHDLELGKRMALELLANGKPLKSVLDVIALSMEKYLQARICSILLYDEQKHCLYLTSAPSMPKEMRHTFKVVPIGPNEGACGAAAYHQKLVVIDDISTHPNRENDKEILLREGLCSCWSKPILSSENALLGTIAVYYQQKKQPTSEELLALSSLSNLMAIAIKYAKMENTLRSQSLSIHQSTCALDKQIYAHKEFFRALEHNEFILYYQPLYHVSTKKVTGAEALIRWKHPKHGIISPSQFIPLAEDNRMIIPIGEWVISTACKQIRKWQQQGLGPISISVNVSPVQLEETEFEEMLYRVIRSSGIDPELFSIEITERILIHPKTVTIIKRLSELGIRIAIDDFGAGYSSLSYLKQLPVHRVKLDRSFIGNLPVSKHDITITRAIYEICKTLGYELIAEGVETIEQFQFLCNMNCHYIQGFCISQPIPSDLFEKRFLRQHFIP